MHFIAVATQLISDSLPGKERSRLAEVFRHYLQQGREIANQNIALCASAYHVSLLPGIGIYDLSKNGGIDTELFLHLT